MAYDFLNLLNQSKKFDLHPVRTFHAYKQSFYFAGPIKNTERVPFCLAKLRHVVRPVS